MPKFFTREICGDTIKICGPDAKHLIKVLRKRPGDGIMVCDGDGFDYHAVIESADGETVITRITGREENRCEPAVRVTVYQAVPKGSKMETVVQKCTELGAFAFVPFTSEYSVVRDDARGYAKSGNAGRRPRTKRSNSVCGAGFRRSPLCWIFKKC